MPETMKPPAASGSAVVRPRPLKWHQRCAARAVCGLLRGVAWTTRFRCSPDGTSPNFITERTEPLIYCVWHDRLALSMAVWRRFAQQRHRGLAAMVSASRDGGVVARVLESFGAQPVRGSTSRRGRQALLEMTTWAERGFDLAITPDGPRGPRHIVQPGVLYLAQLTGLAIVPISYDLTRAVQLRSWDRFLVPLPFGACLVKFGSPLLIDRDADEEHLEQARQQLEKALGD